MPDLVPPREVGDTPRAIQRATEQMEEFGRHMESLARDAEAELRARGIKPDPHIPVLDQLAEAEGLWHSGVLR
jgi:hypothetical protein